MVTRLENPCDNLSEQQLLEQAKIFFRQASTDIANSPQGYAVYGLANGQYLAVSEIVIHLTAAGQQIHEYETGLFQGKPTDSNVTTLLCSARFRYPQKATNIPLSQVVEKSSFAGNLPMPSIDSLHDFSSIGAPIPKPQQLGQARRIVEAISTQSPQCIISNPRKPLRALLGI